MNIIFVKTVLISSLVYCSLIGFSCNRFDRIELNSNTIGDTSLLPPVETKPANSNYASAFKGQTRVSGVKTNTSIKIELLNASLGHPWGLAFLPDGRMIISEKSGFFYLLSADGKTTTKITGVPEINSDGQGGLLDVFVDPNFATTKGIYWTFAKKEQGGSLTAIAKGTLNETKEKVENVVILFKAGPALNSTVHYGSRMVMDKRGNILFTVGEKSIDEGRVHAQNLATGLGKILRITKNGRPAIGNPFLNKMGVMPEIYSYGHRNPQSLDIHPTTGEIWEAEFGPRGGDELNVISPGKNYGWPTITYGLEYSGSKVGAGIQQKSGMEQPVYYWDPVLSPSGMAFYKGTKIAEWKNNLFIGGLNSLHIARLIIQNHRVVGEEKLFTSLKERFRDIGYYNESLYTITDSGKLFKISKK